ncbi:MAG: hypothetical protein HY913_18820 [Desulfomonile tiedjei]|nr:hypothetical protein [Desulfomonile tiedjei]
MNNQAVALAADSAVTMRDQESHKIFPSANKIFSLSKYHPVGIMVYGSASFMGIPWETIIKMYRSQLGTQHFPSLRIYADRFLSFLGTASTISSEAHQEQYVAASLSALFSFLSKEVIKAANDKMCAGVRLTETGIKRIASQAIKQHYEFWLKGPLLENLPSDYKRDLKRKYIGIIEKYKKEAFEKLPLSQKTSRTINNIALEYFSRSPLAHTGISGLVVAGFGTDDAFPSLVSFSIDGIAANVLRYVRDSEMELGLGTGASIAPFAQSEMVVRFMDGVDPLYERTTKGLIANILHQYPQVIIDNIPNLTHAQKKGLKAKLADEAQKQFEGIEKMLAEFKKEEFSSRVLKVVTMLPKDALALMAESLVSLTSFKRKMSMEAETVGEPIDVAVISKGDGFVWIKRKRYFPAELNQQFFRNYFRRIDDDKNNKGRKKKV